MHGIRPERRDLFHTFIFIFYIKDVCNSPNKHSLEYELFYGSFHTVIFLPSYFNEQD